MSAWCLIKVTNSFFLALRSLASFYISFLFWDRQSLHCPSPNSCQGLGPASTASFLLFFLSLYFLSFLSFTGSGVSRGQYFSRLHSAGSCCSDTQQLGWWVKFTTVYKDWCCVWWTFILNYSFECLFVFFSLPDPLYYSVFTSQIRFCYCWLFMKKVAFITLHGCSFTPISVSFLLIIGEWFIDMEPVICLLWRNLCTVH